MWLVELKYQSVDECHILHKIRDLFRATYTLSAASFAARLYWACLSLRALYHDAPTYVRPLRLLLVKLNLTTSWTLVSARRLPLTRSVARKAVFFGAL